MDLYLNSINVLETSEEKYKLEVGQYLCLLVIRIYFELCEEFFETVRKENFEFWLDGAGLNKLIDIYRGVLNVVGCQISTHLVEFFLALH